MKYSDVTIAATPEVLKRKLGGEYFKDICLDATAFTNGFLAAGSAVAANGKKSKGDGSDVYGITLNDAYEDNPNVSVIVAFAVINGANSTATSSDRAALTNLYFE
jgi:hypothetical protein